MATRPAAPCVRSAASVSSCAMSNCFGVELHPDSVRWAAAEGVSQDVIAATLLLHERSVDEIAPQLSATELEQVIKLVGRSPRLYARGMLEALEQRKSWLAPTPPAESLPRRPKSKPPALIADTRDMPLMDHPGRRVTRPPGPRSMLTKCAWRMSAGLKCSAHTRLRARRSPRGPSRQKNPEPVPERALKQSDGGSKWRS